MKPTNYSKFCNKIFGKFFLKQKEKELAEKTLLLEKAYIAMDYHQYYSMAVMNIFFGFFVSLIASAIIYVLLPNTITIALLFFIPTIIVIILAVTYMNLPTYLINRRAENIDTFLPYAINFISSMAVAGVSPTEIFQTLSTVRVYGELQKESKRIAKEITVMGIDNITALKNAIELSPSRKFKSFLQGMIGTIQSGSDLNIYLSHVAEKYLEDDLIERKKHLELLGVVAESFVISVIAFPIFLVIILSIMGFFGGSMDVSIWVLFLFSFAVLPLVYIAFYVLTRSATSESITKYVAEEKTSFGDFFKTNKIAFYIFFLSVFALIIFSIIILVLSSADYVESGLYLNLDIIFISILFVIGPISFYLYSKFKEKREMQERLPEFLEEIGDSLSSGMTTLEAIKVAEKGKYGRLNPEISKMKAQLSWNIAVKDVFLNLADRIKSGIVQRIVVIINEGLIMGGNTSKVFKAAAKEVTQVNQIDHQRKANMSIYMSVIVLCFFVFLAIILILDKTIFTSFFEIQSQQVLQTSGIIQINPIDPLLLKYGLFSFVYVQAIGAGVLAGYMMDGKLTSGVRYAIILAIISLVVFKLLF